MPEDLPVTKCINVMVGITRFKVIFVFFSRFLPLFRESWLGPPLPKSLEIFFVFPRFLPSVGYFKGMNHRQSCQSAFGSAGKHLKISS
jgi:hypothetical protein